MKLGGRWVSATGGEVFCLLWVELCFTPGVTVRSYITLNKGILHIFHVSISCSSLSLIAICEGKVGSFVINEILWLFPLLQFYMPSFDPF